jgi:hypothetical protein
MISIVALQVRATIRQVTVGKGESFQALKPHSRLVNVGPGQGGKPMPPIMPGVVTQSVLKIDLINTRRSLH